MKVFLSWSGQRSHDIAQAFAKWLPTVLFTAKPWISSADIEKGSTWITSIKEGLSQSEGMGIFFLTREALSSPWLLFEAGSVASLGHQRVCVVYVDIEASEIQAPLSLFQGTKLQKDDLFQLLKSINKALASPMDDEILTTTFERGWSDLEQKVKDILTASDKTPKRKKPTTEQVLADIAESTQRIEARLSVLETDSRARQWFAALEDPIPTRSSTLDRDILLRRAKLRLNEIPLDQLQTHLASLSPRGRADLARRYGFTSIDDLLKARKLQVFLGEAKDAESPSNEDPDDEVPL